MATEVGLKSPTYVCQFVDIDRLMKMVPEELTSEIEEPLTNRDQRRT